MESRRSICSNCVHLTIMQDCLAAQHLLDDVIKKLSFREKFTIQLICREWRSRAKVCLRSQKRLVISQFPQSNFGWIDSCPDHPIHSFMDDFICHSFSDIEFWRDIMKTMNSLEVIFFDCRSAEFDESGQDRVDMFAVLEIILTTQSKSLKCLCLPEYGDGEADNCLFPFAENLPQLEHLYFWETKTSNMRRLLTSCPNLKILKCSAHHEFEEWNLLPVGVQKLNSREGSFKGINSLFASPAVESLRSIEYFRLTPDPYRGNFCFRNLEYISVSLKVGADACLEKFAQILRSSPVLRRIELVVLNEDEISTSKWVPVFEACSNIIVMCLESPPRLEDCDFVVELICRYTKKLEWLYLWFSVSSFALTLLSQIPHLREFREIIFDRENMFDEISLGNFLEEAFGKKLNYFELSIAHSSFGTHWTVSSAFVQGITSLSCKHNLEVVIEESGEEAFESSESGMTLLTNLLITRRGIEFDDHYNC